MKNHFIMALLLCLSSSVHAGLIFEEDFEDNVLTYTTNVPDALADLGNRDYFGRTQANQLNDKVDYSNLQGSGFYAVQDTDGASPNTADIVTLTWSAIDISQWDNMLLSWYVAEDDSEDGREDFDSNTAFTIEAQIDGGGFFDLFAVRALGTNTIAAVDTDLNGFGDGQEILPFFTQFSADIKQGSWLDIQVSFANFNAQDEDFAFDQLALNGELKNQNGSSSTSVPEPTSFALMLIALCIARIKTKRS